MRELYEWVDGKPLNVRFVQADMADLPEMELGTFDLAMALCSLYYLETEDMRRVTRHVSRISDLFVLQGNHATGIRRARRDTYEKARAEFLRDLLETHGFQNTRTIAYGGYSRPLVIGCKLTLRPSS